MRFSCSEMTLYVSVTYFFFFSYISLLGCQDTIQVQSIRVQFNHFFPLLELSDFYINKVIPRVILGISQHVVQCVLKKIGNWTSGGQKKKFQALKLSTADEQYLKVMSLRKKKKSIYCWSKLHQKWSPWKGGCQEAILKEGKQGEKRLSYAKWHKKWTENQWHNLDRERNRRQPTFKEELWDVLQEACRLLKEMTECSSKRVQAVLENKTKYWF